MKNKTRQSTSETVKEVEIVKKITKMDSEQYVSVRIKSSDNSIADLLEKAISASNAAPIPASISIAEIGRETCALPI